MRRGGDEEQIADSRLDVKTSFCIKHVPCGLVVRISGFHPGGRGSIPRTGVPLSCWKVGTSKPSPRTQGRRRFEGVMLSSDIKRV